MITLPFPPSLNNLFANGKHGRFISTNYKAWRSEAGKALLTQGPMEKVAGFVEVEFLFHRPDRRKRDLDGLLKGPLDLMVEFGLIEDDSLVLRIIAAWADVPPDKKTAKVEIWVRK